jgi:deoxyribose-phosphate aldolase
MMDLTTLEGKETFGKIAFLCRQRGREATRSLTAESFWAGEHERVFDEVAATKEACGAAHLKLILETGELQTYDNVRVASEIAMRAGADFIKTLNRTSDRRRPPKKGTPLCCRQREIIEALN